MDPFVLLKTLVLRDETYNNRMHKFQYLHPCVLGLALGALSIQSAYAAVTTSWWRFEVDTDSSPTALSVDNEILGEPALTSSNARIGVMAADLFDTIIPGTDTPNAGSVFAVNTGGDNAGIFGTAAYSENLDVASITVEFWVRTTESTAGFVARTSVFENAAESANPTDGFSIVDPNNVRVNFFTSSEDGTDPAPTSLSSNIAINDGNWHYVAFRYDKVSRVAELMVDSQSIVTEAAGIDERPLWWGGPGSAPPVVVGYQMDGNRDNNTGTFDELRIVDDTLEDGDLLIIPEPATVAFHASLGILCLIGFRRFRRTPV